MVKILFKIMVCTDGVAVLLHRRSVRCYYFLLCMPWIDLLFPSHLVSFLSLHMQEAKWGNFARNKRLIWRLCPRHHGFRPWRVCFHWGVGGCFHSGLIGGDGSGNPHGPLCAPVTSRAASAPCCLQLPEQQHLSVPVAISPWHCHCPIAIIPLSQDPFCVGQKTASVAELFLSFDTPYSFCMWAALQQRWTKGMADVEMEMWMPCNVR